MKSYIGAIYIVTALFFSTSSLANRINIISSKEGLSNNSVYNIYQNDLGELFVGTLDGLNIWNGRDMEKKKAQEFNQFFKGNKIRYIFPYDKDHILVLSRYGLAKLNTDTKESQFYEYFMGHNMLCVTQNGNIFSINGNGELEYFELTTGNHHVLNGFNIDPGNNCMRITISEKGDLYIFTGKDSYFVHIDYETGGPEVKEVQQLSFKCQYISQPHCEGPIFIITEEHSLLQFTPTDGTTKELAQLKYPKDTQWQRVNGVIETTTGWYISFWDGLYFLKKGEKELKKTNLDFHIFTIIKDRRQPILWIGCDSYGLIQYQLEDSGIRSITNNQLPLNRSLPIRCIFNDRNNNLWIGTKGNGLLRLNNFNPNNKYDESNSHLYTATNSRLGHNYVYCITESIHNGFYIGTEGPGVNWYSYKTNRISTIKGSLQIRYTHSIEERGDSLLYISTRGKISYKCRISERDGEPIVTAIDTISSQSLFGKNAAIYPITAQNDSIIWIGNVGHGILRHNVKTGCNKPMVFPQSYGLACNEINHIYNDHDIIFATQNGIFVYNESADEKDLPHYLSDLSAKAILKNSHGNIYVSTNSGIEILDSNYNRLRSFGRHSGLSVLEYSNSACYKDPKTGTMYFGGINGFSVIQDISIDEISLYTPAIEVTHLSNAGEEIHISKSIKDGKLQIPYSDNTYTLQFSAIDHINPLGHEFLWSIEGYSSTIFTSDDFQIHLPNLDPGNYNLKIWHANKPETSYSLPFYIKPPFYRTIWAYIVYALMTLLTIHVIAKRIRNRYSLMRQQLKEKYTEQIKRIKQDTQSSIAEDLMIQITFILGLCQHIRSYSKSNTLVSEKVNMIEQNINKISQTLNLYHSFKNLSSDIEGNASSGLVDIGAASKEIIELVKSSPDFQGVSVSYKIDVGIVYMSNKELYNPMFKTLLNIANLLVTKQKNMHIEIGGSDALNISLKVPSNHETYQIICTTDNHISVCKDFVEHMNGEMLYSFDDEIVNIKISLPLVSTGSDIQPKTEKPVTSLNVDKVAKEPLYIISKSQDISSFLQYFMSDNHNISIFKDIDILLSAIELTTPVAIIYDISSMYSSLKEFMKNISKGNMKDFTPVIIISSSQQVSEREECIKYGVDLCLSFPFNINTLNTALEKLQNKREKLAEYYRHPSSSFVVKEGQRIHVEDKQLLKNIVKIIDEHLSDPTLSVPKIAEKLGMNTRDLYRKLRKTSEMSLKQIVVEVRMQTAASLLSTTKLTIDEIMYKVGYNNESTFFRTFKSFHGITPKEYRKHSQQQNFHS